MVARQLGRRTAAALVPLFLMSMLLPGMVAASTPIFGVTQQAPTPTTVNYSDLVTLRGAYTCLNSADGTANCPTTSQSKVATFSIRPTGTSDPWVDWGVVTTSFTFTTNPAGCTTTCSKAFSVQVKAGRGVGGVTIPPAAYDLRLTTTLTSDEVILTNGITITPEGTTTTYTGATSGDEGTSLALAASVLDVDKGLLAGSSIITPDTNLMASTHVTFALYDSTNTNLVVGPVSASLLGSGLTWGSPSLTLPAGGTYQLRTTYEGNDFYSTSTDLDTVTSNVTNTPPTISVPDPISAEATSSAGASVGFTVTATDAEDDPDPTPSCDWASGATFPIGVTTVTCSVTDAGALTDTDAFTVTVVDTTAPGISVTTAESVGDFGWYNAASNDGTAGVTIDVAATDAVGTASVTCTDNGTDVGSLGAPGGSFVLGDGSHVVSCSALDASGNSSTAGGTFDVDQTAPTIGGSFDVPAAGSGWWNASTGAPTVTYACADLGSGLASCSDPHTFGEGADQGDTGTAVDVAGNVATTGVSNVDVDLVAPTSVAFVGGGVSDGGNYVFGSVPAGPTACTAAYGTSGAGSCLVSGYDTSVGGQTVTATATDAAGNVATASMSFTVQPWTVSTFGGSVSSSGWNSAKAGTQVNLKWEVFAGAVEVASVGAIAGVTQTPVGCATGAPLGDPQPAPAHAKSALRYDTSAGMFFFNWDTPAAAGSCWEVRVTTIDGSWTAADFRLR